MNARQPNPAMCRLCRDPRAEGTSLCARHLAGDRARKLAERAKRKLHPRKIIHCSRCGGRDHNAGGCLFGPGGSGELYRCRLGCGHLMWDREIQTHRCSDGRVSLEDLARGRRGEQEGVRRTAT